MRKFILLCASLAAMVLLISASPVRAQNVLWVSATGNDASACTTAAPCATFQGAFNKGLIQTGHARRLGKRRWQNNADRSRLSGIIR